MDGRADYVRFADIEFTRDATPGAIVEVLAYEDSRGRKRLSVATGSDLPIEAQVAANGATSLDRQLLAREPVSTGIRARPCQYAAAGASLMPLQQSSRTRQAWRTDRPRQRVRRRDLSAAGGARVKSLRHDRRWTWLPAGAVAAGP